MTEDEESDYLQRRLTRDRTPPPQVWSEHCDHVFRWRSRKVGICVPNQTLAYAFEKSDGTFCLCPLNGLRLVLRE